jgi:hypothetical protein
MKSEKEIKELTVKLKNLSDTLKDALNQIRIIADEIGDEDAHRIVIKNVFVQSIDDIWFAKDMSVHDWANELTDCVKYVEIEQAK